MSARTGNRDELVDLSLTVLCLMLDYVPLANPAGLTAVATGIVRFLKEQRRDKPIHVAPEQLFATNEFQRLLSGVEGRDNYHALHRGVARLMANFVVAQNALLPQSTKELKCFNELVIFLLRLVTTNQVLKDQTTSGIELRPLLSAKGRPQGHHTTAAVHSG